MNPKDAYKHCLLCGGKLLVKETYFECSQCGHHIYNSPAPCNAVIIENNNGEILLVKRKIDPKKGYWDLPGGFIQPNEAFETSVKREIKEELGIEIEVKQIIGVYHDEYLFQNVFQPTLGIVVSAKILNGKLSASDDISSYKFFPKTEVLKQKIAFKSIAQGLENYLKK
jgi:ADP-ribose pyrophosphatase YjhB (NUDIX family)